ncbi:DLW-39 family protein [Phytoactinopolyspora halophila]|nr:DLW-39 family protein [Phytoactinopolyspora halophila]
MSKKKILLTALVAVGGYLGYRRYQSSQEERDLWAEATDPVPPADQS